MSGMEISCRLVVLLGGCRRHGVIRAEIGANEERIDAGEAATGDAIVFVFGPTEPHQRLEARAAVIAAVNFCVGWYGTTSGIGGLKIELYFDHHDAQLDHLDG